MALYTRKCLPLAPKGCSPKASCGPRMFLRMVGAQIIPVEEVNRVDPQGLSFLNVNFPGRPCPVCVKSPGPVACLTRPRPHDVSNSPQTRPTGLSGRQLPKNHGLLSFINN